jgi:hypothetical protein
MKKIFSSILTNTLFLFTCIFGLNNKILVSAEEMTIEDGNPIIFKSFEKLLWDIIVTIQYYTLPIMAIALVLLGIKLLTSGDDTSVKETVKSWIIKILIGGVIIFGAATFASIIKTNVNIQ